jgi:hypothetical protein
MISFMGYLPSIFSKRIFYSVKNNFHHPIIGNGAIVRKLMVQKVKKLTYLSLWLQEILLVGGVEINQHVHSRGD